MTAKFLRIIVLLALVLSPAGHGMLGAARPALAQQETLSPPAGLALLGVRMVVTGYSHACALTSGRGVKCWGLNDFGQLGDGTRITRYAAVDVIGLTSGVLSLAAGGFHTCALLITGGVKCWGFNQFGQLGLGYYSESELEPKPVYDLATGGIGLVAGLFHTCVRLQAGGVRCWGNNLTGQLGAGLSLPDSAAPVSVVGLTGRAIGLAASPNHTCVLTEVAGVKCWGLNESGQLGDGTTLNRNIPVDVVGLVSGVRAIAAGGNEFLYTYPPPPSPIGHTCALLISGMVKCWGDNSSGQLGDGTFEDRRLPVDVTSLSGPITSLFAAWTSSCVVSASGSAQCWGGGASIPAVMDLLSQPVAALALSEAFTCAIAGSGELFCWGANIDGQLGAGEYREHHIPLYPQGLAPGVAGLTLGYSHTCALTVGGGVFCWGDNHTGQLGDGTSTTRYQPVEVVGLGNGALAVAAGRNHTCALAAGGVAMCWGANNDGQLGDGSTVERYLPVSVSGLASGALALAAGFSHTCVLTASGGVNCWGSNTSGQLGDGTMEGRLTPVQVAGLESGVLALDAGDYHTCALMADGRILCWGSNSYGQLGDGTEQDRLMPTAVIGLPGEVLAVAAGASHTCAILAGGRLMCWGNNSFGALGDGTTLHRNTPVDVLGLESEVTALTAGVYSTCAVATGGSAKCWGYNVTGQLGDGTTEDRVTPADVRGLMSGATAIAAGEFHSCALLSSQQVKCWGYNFSGQLGLGRHVEIWWQTSPVPVVQAHYLAVNQRFGRPGSVFTFYGEHFSQIDQATVMVNGVLLTDTLQIDPSGGIIFFLDTSGASPGVYHLSVHTRANDHVVASITLDDQYSLLPPDGGGVLFTLPAGIAMSRQSNLPLVRK